VPKFQALEGGTGPEKHTDFRIWTFSGHCGFRDSGIWGFSGPGVPTPPEIMAFSEPGGSKTAKYPDPDTHILDPTH
tara:strand:- start:593 stop:820 length:228 start_codon:yes stop_codon:yes gene_type:complete